MNTMPSDVHDILMRSLAQMENLQGELRYERELRMKVEAEAKAAAEHREEEFKLREAEYIFRKEKLISELSDIRKSPGTSGSEVAELNRTIETLNKTIESLRADNAALTEMLQKVRKNRRSR